MASSALPSGYERHQFIYWRLGPRDHPLLTSSATHHTFLYLLLSPFVSCVHAIAEPNCTYHLSTAACRQGALSTTTSHLNSAHFVLHDIKIRVSPPIFASRCLTRQQEAAILVLRRVPQCEHKSSLDHSTGVASLAKDPGISGVLDAWLLVI